MFCPAAENTCYFASVNSASVGAPISSIRTWRQRTRALPIEETGFLLNLGGGRAGL